MRRFFALFSAAVVVPLVWISGCGTDAPSSGGTFPIGPQNGNNSDGGGVGNGDDSSAITFGGGGEGGTTGVDSGAAPCVEGLCKQQQYCMTGSTTVSGTVFDPAGNTPLYNVLVYVPNDPGMVTAITHGASCDRCGSVSGNPLVSTITDTQGKFTLHDVPVGTDIPLIIQVGKWRRQIKIPSVTACVDNPLTDVTQTRLPRNQQEGDIPKIAITTGGADSLECFLRSGKLGLDESEFTLPGGGGSVNFYSGVGASTTKYTSTAKDPTIAAAAAGQNFPSAQTFWNSQANLMPYDLVLLSCEGSSTNQPQTQNKGQAAYDAMYAYGSAGGRIFATHWHYIWFSGEPALSPAGVNWAGDGTGGNTDPSGAALVNDTFPKGQAFRDWLVNVGASPAPDQLTIQQPKYNVDSTGPAATTWITMNNHTAYMTANLPLGAADDKVCGRAVYSDLHIGGATINGKTDGPGPDWPTGCVTSGMSAQEKALEFLLFDLSSCVQPDSQPPAPPPPGVK
jgi:hypothetical protein